MAAAETKKGQPREWNVAILEADVAGPARFLGAGGQDASQRGAGSWLYTPKIARRTLTRSAPPSPEGVPVAGPTASLTVNGVSRISQYLP
jgi:hypothetical protein